MPENVDLLAFGELLSQFPSSLLRWQNRLGTAWPGREPEVKRPECTLLAALPCFFRSRYVRAATLLSISQARKWFPSL